MISIGEASMLVSGLGTIPYIRAIIKGNVRPERVTWFVWSVILALAIWGYHSSGGSDSTWFLIGDFVVTFTIFLLSLWRGQGGLNRLDISCLLIAFGGLVVSQLAQQPIIIVVGAVLADTVALIPTLKKALLQPDTESASTYSFTAVAATMGVLAVGQWNLLLLFYPVYLFLANFVAAIVILVSQYQARRIVRAKPTSPVSSSARKAGASLWRRCFVADTKPLTLA